MSGLTIVLAMLIGAVCLLALAAVGTIRCRLRCEAIEVLVLWMVVRRIPLADIEEVRRRGRLRPEARSGPPFRNVVTIRRRRGLLKNLTVTADDPDRFVADLASLIEARKSGAGIGQGS